MLGYEGYHNNNKNYSYQFEYSPIGTLGAVVCTVCERKALKRCLGNEVVYEELMKKYDANFCLERFRGR